MNLVIQLDKDEFKKVHKIEYNEDFIQFINSNILNFLKEDEKDFFKNILNLME